MLQTIVQNVAKSRFSPRILHLVSIARWNLIEAGGKHFELTRSGLGKALQTNKQEGQKHPQQFRCPSHNFVFFHCKHLVVIKYEYIV
jgi:hypothetical protein